MWRHQATPHALIIPTKAILQCFWKGNCYTSVGGSFLKDPPPQQPLHVATSSDPTMLSSFQQRQCCSASEKGTATRRSVDLFWKIRRLNNHYMWRHQVTQPCSHHFNKGNVAEPFATKLMLQKLLNRGCVAGKKSASHFCNIGDVAEGLLQHEWCCGNILQSKMMLNCRLVVSFFAIEALLQTLSRVDKDRLRHVASVSCSMRGPHPLVIHGRRRAKLMKSAGWRGSFPFRKSLTTADFDLKEKNQIRKLTSLQYALVLSFRKQIKSDSLLP